MRTPTDAQISAAHDAWERTTTEWIVVRAGSVWLLENNPSRAYEAGRDYASEIAYYKFEGPNAEQTAKFALRDKVIRAALSAALEIEK